MSNEFLAFCPTDTGTNLLTQAEYLVASDRTNGNQPGVAKSKLVNKALRQACYVTGQFAQFLANLSATDVLDDATPARLQSQIEDALKNLPPTLAVYQSGSGNHNLTYIFFIASGSATAAATYTNNSITYTVKETVASGTVLKASGSGAPLVTGTLTKTGGTGDSTLTFYAVRAPLYLVAELVGAGGGGSGSGSTGAGPGGAGGNTTFGSALLIGGGGAAGPAPSSQGGAGGTTTVAAGATGFGIAGGAGQGNATSNGSGNVAAGGNGGVSFFGGAGPGGANTVAGVAAAANSGSGGGGGGCSNNAGISAGTGGGAGGYVRATINSPTGQYAYAVGAAGSAGTAGTNGLAGGAGGSGLIYTSEHYQ